MSSAKPPNYIASLDGLRAVSIAFVFFAHAGLSNLIPGGFGVTVFFFLSGYLITRLLLNEHATHGSIAIKAFYLRRLVRLAPPLALTLIASCTLVSLGLARGDLAPAAITAQALFYYNYFTLYFSHLGNSVDGLGVLWSLAVEEHFYLIYPWLFIWIARGRLALSAMAGLLIAILLWRMVRFHIFGHHAFEIFIGTDTRFDSILYGCLLAVMEARGRAERWFPKTYMYPLIGLACVVILFTFVYRDPAFRSTFRYSLQGLALLPIFYYATSRPEHWMFQPLNWKPVRRIGQYSYTFYLIHFVVIKAMIFNDAFTDNRALFILVSGALSIGFAAFVYEVAEKPLKPLRARLTGH